MFHGQIETIVITILSAVLKQNFEMGTIITRKNTPRWDSLKHIEIMLALEEELEIEFTEVEFASLDSLDQIVDSCVSKRAA